MLNSYQNILVWAFFVTIILFANQTSAHPEEDRPILKKIARPGNLTRGILGAKLIAVLPLQIKIVVGGDVASCFVLCQRFVRKEGLQIC